MARTGIVFSGGGGKGAYEVGVWQALREYRVDSNISAVAGTSVGGLNGALFVQGDLERAEQLWLDIAKDKILQLDLRQLAEKLSKVAVSLAIPGVQGKLLLTIAQALQGKGWFSQAGLADLIQQSEVCHAVSPSQLPFYVCALAQRTGELTLPKLNGLSAEDISNWLLATAAIPGVFSTVTINGSNYWDGGVLPGRFSNNTPFQPLIEKEQCTHIINIYLSRSPEVAAPQSAYPETRFWNIIPSEEFDGLISALNFTPENAEKLIALGYRDTVSILERFKSFMDDEERYLDAVFDFQQSDNQFVDQIHLNQGLRYQGEQPATSTEVAPLSYKEVMDQLATSINQQERQLINSGLDTLIDEMKGNSEDLLEEAFTAITTLSSTEGRINSQLEQGFLGRLVGSITGSNFQQQAEINKGFQASLYATQSLVQKLNHKQMLSMEAMVSLSNKCSYLMSHINMLYGAVNSQEQQQLENFRLFSHGIDALSLEVEQKFEALSGRVERLEYKQVLDDWYHEIRNIKCDREPVELLLQATGSFYETCGRQWSAPELNRFKSALSDLGLTQQFFSVEQCVTVEASKALSRSIEVGSILPVAPKYEQFHTLLKGTQLALEGQSGRYVQQWQQQLPVEIHTPVCGEQLALELLYSLRRNDRRKPVIPGMHNDSSLKSKYLDTLESLQEIAAQVPLGQPFNENLSYLADKINHFKVVVPIIGKFSAGKSALLNRYLGRDFLASEITPETAIATEIGFGEREFIVLNYHDGRKEERPFADLQNLEVNDSLGFVQVFVNNPKLKHRPDLVLVDMPGFDSRNQSHHKAIAWYLNRGDVFINLLPSNVPFDASIMEQLAEIHYDYQKGVVCLISKAGRRTPKELTQLQTELAVSLGDCLQYETTPQTIEALDRNGSIEAFEQQLDKAVRNYDGLLANRYQAGIFKSIETAISSIQNSQRQISGGEHEIEQQIESAESEFQRTEQKLKGLLSELQYNLCSVGREILIEEATGTLNAATDQLVRAAKNNALNQELTTLLRPVMQYSLKEMIENALKDLQNKLDRLPQQEGMINIHLQLPPEEQEAFNASGAAIAAGLAAVVFGPIGAVLGGFFGGLIGRRNNAEEREQQIRQTVTQKVIPEAVQQVAGHIENQLQQTVISLGNSIKKQLQEEQHNYQQQLAHLQETLASTLNAQEELKAQHQKWLDRLIELKQPLLPQVNV